MTEHRLIRTGGKTYVTPIYEDDYVVENFKTGVKVFDWRMSNHAKFFQRHKNRSVNLDKTITFD